MCHLFIDYQCTLTLPLADDAPEENIDLTAEPMDVDGEEQDPAQADELEKDEDVNKDEEGQAAEDLEGQTTTFEPAAGDLNTGHVRLCASVDVLSL